MQKLNIYIYWREAIEMFRRQQAYCILHRVQLCIYTVSQKNCANIFLSELCQISTDHENFWQKDNNEDKLFWSILIFHLTWFMSTHYRVKRRCSKLLHNAVIIACSKLQDDLISIRWTEMWLQHLECSAEESLPLQNRWRRWTQNASDRWMSAVWPVDRWCRYQP